MVNTAGKTAALLEPFARDEADGFGSRIIDKGGTSGGNAGIS